MNDAMKQFWDARARENAVWYVDTTVDYDDPDWDHFFASGRTIAAHALGRSPLPPRRHEVALEVGAGLGRICQALADDFDHVIGVDISDEMVRQARELVTADNVEFRVSDGTTLTGIEDDSVDFVVSFTVLQHLPSPEIVTGYLQEVARVLRPGGVLAIQWNNCPPLRYRTQTAWLRLQARLGRGEQHRYRDAPEFRGTPVRLPVVRRTLEQAGLTVHQTEGEGTLFAWLWAAKP